MTPFFSIIIPTYNRAKLLTRAVGSVTSQDFSNFELIVVDDGSSDDTENLVSAINDTRIKYIKQENKGVCAARNTGSKNATGTFLIFLDSDDQLGAGCLIEYRKSMGNNIKLSLGYSVFEDSNGNSASSVEPWKSDRDFSHPLTGSFAIDRKLFLELGGYDERLFFSETSDFFLRLRTERKDIISEVALAPGAGVHIVQGDLRVRKERYSMKKYESVKYFLTKHKLFFNTHPEHFVNFKRVHGMCALQNGQTGEAKQAFWEVLLKAPFSWRSHFHFYFVLLAPVFAIRYYLNRAG